MSSCYARIYLVRFLILMYVARFSMGSALAESEKRPSLEALKIGSFQVMKADMEQALEALRRTAPSKMLVGIEKARGNRIDISFELKGVALSEVLNQLCKADPRYTYEFIGDSLINVLPLRAKGDTSNLLNIRVKYAVIKEKTLPSEIIRRIPDFAPELSRYMEDKAKERAKFTGVPNVTVGARMSGDMDPQISLEFRNKTVREILNGISLHSVEVSRQGSYSIPVSWKYEFVVDPSAATGLGGYPKWDIF